LQRSDRLGVCRSSSRSIVNKSDTRRQGLGLPPESPSSLRYSHASQVSLVEPIVPYCGIKHNPGAAEKPQTKAMPERGAICRSVDCTPEQVHLGYRLGTWLNA
jgi:hypothetical protein